MYMRMCHMVQNHGRKIQQIISYIPSDHHINVAKVCKMFMPNCARYTACVYTTRWRWNKVKSFVCTYIHTYMGGLAYLAICSSFSRMSSFSLGYSSNRSSKPVGEYHVHYVWHTHMHARAHTHSHTDRQTQVHTHVRVLMHPHPRMQCTHTHACSAHTHTYTYVHTHTHTDKHRYTHTHIPTHAVHTHAHIHTHPRSHMYTHTRMHAHTHAHTHCSFA